MIFSFLFRSVRRLYDQNCFKKCDALLKSENSVRKLRNILNLKAFQFRMLFIIHRTKEAKYVVRKHK